MSPQRGCHALWQGPRLSRRSLGPSGLLWFMFWLLSCPRSIWSTCQSGQHPPLGYAFVSEDQVCASNNFIRSRAGRAFQRQQVILGNTDRKSDTAVDTTASVWAPLPPMPAKLQIIVHIVLLAASCSAGSVGTVGAVTQQQLDEDAEALEVACPLTADEMATYAPEPAVDAVRSACEHSGCIWRRHHKIRDLE